MKKYVNQLCLYIIFFSITGAIGFLPLPQTQIGVMAQDTLECDELPSRGGIALCKLYCDTMDCDTCDFQSFDFDQCQETCFNLFEVFVHLTGNKPPCDQECDQVFSCGGPCLTDNGEVGVCGPSGICPFSPCPCGPCTSLGF
jgi:hypothetical protein